MLRSQNSFERSAGKEYISGNATNTLSPKQVLLYDMCCVRVRVMQGALVHSSCCGDTCNRSVITPPNPPTHSSNIDPHALCARAWPLERWRLRHIESLRHLHETCCACEDCHARISLQSCPGPNQFFCLITSA